MLQREDQEQSAAAAPLVGRVSMCSISGVVLVRICIDVLRLPICVRG